MAYYKKQTAGFSLIELLVTLTIATLVVGSVMFQFRIYDSIVVLKGLAYEMAFTLREAQVFAVSSGVSTDGATFDLPYGIYVDLDSPQEYIFFQDNNENGRYDSSDIIIETYEIKDAFTLSQICVDADCVSADSSVTNEREVSVVYRRPEFDAMYDVRDGGSLIDTSGTSELVIRFELESDDTIYFDVVAGITGQISVTGT